ncbi:hypothetical protein BCR43DRAFT_489658 [Syncephalastrum racemosum]|uniref:PHD-type domain-containing protein n=1 Tax=Syncephalastrum racemosum TaxID=13706 RepID=A0A1X2HEH6_SYNRA|nr:hypothetical protein BCR43DRAFT_489658 [Syncephalastrum racemosum]
MTSSATQAGTIPTGRSSEDRLHAPLQHSNKIDNTASITTTDSSDSSCSPVLEAALGTDESETTMSLAKPKAASAGVRHESTSSLLPIASPQLSIGGSPTTWQLLLCSYYYQQLPPIVKDDVFLAPAAGDNESVVTNSSSDTNGLFSSGCSSSTSSSSSSSSSAADHWAPTPCLSPVSSPSDFLCNHEPLFDGIEDLHSQQSSDESESVKSPREAPSTDIAWYDGVDQPTALPTPSSHATSETECDLFFLDDSLADFNESDTNTAASTVETEDSSDDDEDAGLQPSLKRKRVMYDQEEDDDDEDIEDNDGEGPMRRGLSRLRLSDYYRHGKKAMPGPNRRAKCKTVTKRRTRKCPGRRPRSRIVAVNHDVQNHDDGNITLFERLTQAGIDWCRYCGTTEGVNWRPGPWGKRTLCNKHGCDYKGYGIASRLPRLDLSAFSSERLEDRRRPVVQQFCVVCQTPDSHPDNALVPCEGGCSRAYHQLCRAPPLSDLNLDDDEPWCCSALCRENRKRNKVGPYEL